MHSQDTPHSVRDREVALVREVASLGASDVVEFEDEGWDSRVYIVNRGEVVFKFPRSAVVQARFGEEVMALRALESLDLPVWTPRVQWVGPEFAYFGYEGMRGASPDLDELRPEARTELGAKVGAFVAVLHRLDLPDLRVTSVEDEIADYQAKHAAAGAILAEHVGVAERRRLDEFFGVTVPAELRRLGGDPRLCHSDLGPWNLIVDGNGSVGVIDFGDVAYCDRSKDLIGLFDEVALEAALGAYGDAPGLREKIAVRAAALPMMDLLFFAGKRDERRLAICLDRIRRIHGL